MKVILSRKGFDSASGGIPSPILPDGKAVSLPIPAKKSPLRFRELRVDGYDLRKIISDLGNSNISLEQCVHLDPDIDRGAVQKRLQGWRGAFGQVGAAQGHLAKKGVGKGDIFVFFGWFKEIYLHNGNWRYKPDAPDLHVIYGWLFVDEVLPVYGSEVKILNKHRWLEYHPHLCGFNGKNNTIYIGKKSLPAIIESDKQGYGVFERVKDIHVLTDTDQNNRSVWKLPLCFYPDNCRRVLSYHGNSSRWQVKDNDWVTLRTVGRGQEFVLDAAYFPGVIEWLKRLFS